MHKSWFSRMCIAVENFKLAERKRDHRHRVIKKGNYYPVCLLFCHTREQEKEKQADASGKTYIFTRNTYSSSNFKGEYLITSVSSSWWFLQLQVFLLHGWFIQQNSWSDKESFWNPWSGQEWFHWRRGAAVSTVQLLYFFKQHKPLNLLHILEETLDVILKIKHKSLSFLESLWIPSDNKSRHYLTGHFRE